jgi:anaerobic ribonucleoside-triphosphate reductase activating protein
MSEAVATIRLSRVHYPVTVLGPGRRIGVWVQGCGIGCRGCIAKDTWDRGGGRIETIEALLAWMRATARPGFDGITITGGEPFEQPAALMALLRGLCAWRAEGSGDFDILCYSGFPLARLQERHGEILTLLDALIPEPFVNANPIGATWQGSDNQPLIPLSRRGEERYRPYLEGRVAISKSLQFAVTDRSIWFIGIPARGDMDRLVALGHAQGLEVENMSWRTAESARIAASPTKTEPA